MNVINIGKRLYVDSIQSSEIGEPNNYLSVFVLGECAQGFNTDSTLKAFGQSY